MVLLDPTITVRVNDRRGLGAVDCQREPSRSCLERQSHCSAGPVARSWYLSGRQSRWLSVPVPGRRDTHDQER